MDDQKLAEVFLRINTRGLAKSFVENLFTEKERSEFAKRLLIFGMLEKGMPHRKIAERLGVGVETVSRGARQRKSGSKYFLSWWSELYQSD